MHEDNSTGDWIYAGDPINQNGKSIATSTYGKSFLRAKRTLLFKVNAKNVICATANFYDATLQNGSISGEEHLVMISNTGYIFETNVYTNANGYNYKIFIASFL